ncbi:MAG: MerR family transcriptional regulator [Alphaproteobacteria bacterium]|nr:MerR family transcriptional regulator [Alphaproteobacteria bacterium]
MADVADPGGRRPSKSAAAFRTISEVSGSLDVPQHVLRFWETKFTQVRPLKRGGGRRYYRPEDVELLRAIRTLLYDEGYTIKGVQKLLREGGIKAASQRLDGGETAEPEGERAPIAADIAGWSVAVPGETRPAPVALAAGTAVALDAGMRGELRALLDELEGLRASLGAVLGKA